MTITEAPAARLMAPDSARRAALAFIADGITAEDVRSDLDPRDTLLCQVADAMDGMAGLTPDKARFLLGDIPALVPSAA